MSKTAREVIADYLVGFNTDQDDSLSGARELTRELDAAGFVIVPKAPTDKILGELYGLSDETSGSDEPARELYRRVIAAAKGPP